MKERPILFSAPMVRALLDGSKTQTRRVVKRQFATDAIPAEVSATTPEGWQTSGHSGLWWDDGGAVFEDAIRCPYGMPRDRLWVRESLKATLDDGGLIIDYHYPADGSKVARCPELAPQFNDGMAFAHLARPGGVPAIHMPRWASRVDLEVTGVRVERLQDISAADALAEGVEAWRASWDRKTAATMFLHGTRARFETNDGAVAKRLYMLLWESINGHGSWATNPWVWVVGFTKVKP